MLAHPDRLARVAHVQVQLTHGREGAQEHARKTRNDERMLGLHPEEGLQVEWVELGREEDREQEEDGGVVRKVGCAFPLEGGEVVRGELFQDASCPSAHAARLAAPDKWLPLREAVSVFDRMLETVHITLTSRYSHVFMPSHRPSQLHTSTSSIQWSHQH